MPEIDHNALINTLACDPKITDIFYQEDALRIINIYLETNPNPDNQRVFKQFKNEITHNGFNYYTVLQKKLWDMHARNQLTPLTSYWATASDFSPTTECLRRLYYLATGMELDYQQTRTMLAEGDLPRIADADQLLYYQLSINHLITRPIIYSASKAKEQTLRAYLEVVQEKEDLAFDAQAIQAKILRNAEAAYQEALFSKAREQIQSSDKTKLCFDPQGHVLIEVPPLTEEEFEAAGINAALRNTLHINYDKGSFCSIDILHPAGLHPAELQEEFRNWIKLGIFSVGEVIQHCGQCRSLIEVTENRDRFLQRVLDLATKPRSSIIALQRDMILHMRLAARVLQEKTTAFTTIDDWDKIIQQTTMEINKLVRNNYCIALMENFDAKRFHFNFNEINQQLDEARQIIAPQCYLLLVQTCLSYLPDHSAWLTVINTLKNKDFLGLSATGQDFFRTDATQGIAERVTSDNKNTGTRLVHFTHYIKEHNRIVATPHNVHSVARMPAIRHSPSNQAQKSSTLRGRLKKIFASLDPSNTIQDIVTTLSFAYTETQNQLGGYDGPMTYNPLTSLHWSTSQHSDELLKAAHQFNAQQVKNGQTNSLCYIQNIPVDQHTRQLSDTTLDKTVRETTLMADMALLYTFTQYAHQLTDPIKTILRNSYYEIKQTYYSFLLSAQEDAYFCEMPIADLVREKLHEVKQALASPTNAAMFQLEEATLTELVIKALMRLYSNNHHWNKQFGMLVQSLSTFVERACRVGCPSTDPLLEAVMNRVYLLESLNRKPLLTTAFIKNLRDFIRTNSADPEALQYALDIEVNSSTLYTQIFTNDDSGGCSPLEASSSETGALSWFELDRNIAESGYLTALQQKNAAGLRAQDSALKPADKLKALFAQQVQLFGQRQISRQATVDAAVAHLAEAATTAARDAQETRFGRLFQESRVATAPVLDPALDSERAPRFLGSML